MNNIPVANLPDAPENVADWHLYSFLYNCNQEFGRTETCKQAHRLARRHLLKQMLIMSNTVCRACSGYGHRAKDCLTNDRLSLLGSASVEN